jgi:hypothetical protein
LRAKARELREERKKLVVDAQALPTNTKEERAKVEKMLDDADALKSRIDLLERADTANEEFSGTGSGAPPAGQPGAGGSDDPEVAKKASERHRRAFVNYLRYGMRARPELAKPIRGITKEDRAILWPTGHSENFSESDLENINNELVHAGRSDLDRGELRESWHTNLAGADGCGCEGQGAQRARCSDSAVIPIQFCSSRSHSHKTGHLVVVRCTGARQTGIIATAGRPVEFLQCKVRRPFRCRPCDDAVLPWNVLWYTANNDPLGHGHCSNGGVAVRGGPRMED